MKFQILGGHQVASTEGRPIAFLIDDTIAIDAGGLANSLSLVQQQKIKSILITHHHFDHVADLPFVGLAALEIAGQIEVIASQLVYDVLRAHLLNNVLWLDLFNGPVHERPSLIHRLITPQSEFQVGDYRVLAIENRHHAVPVTAYQFTSHTGKKLLYTGDTGPGINDIWPVVEPDVLVTEVTMQNSKSDFVPLIGHLTPQLLEQELLHFRGLKGYLPEVIACHVNQAHESIVARELAEVEARLGTPIRIAQEGMQIIL